MMLKEFEELTGFRPSHSLYNHIEAAYTDFNGSKQDFCKAYVENKNGIAEVIQRRASMEEINAESIHRNEMREKDVKIAKLEKELENELEWKPYEYSGNVKQIAYEDLKAASDTTVLTDEKAKDLLYDWFGFVKEKIEIVHTVEKCEINRHRIIRKVGENSRQPLYNATDWNYIRFDCGRMSYELCDGDLKLFTW